MVSESIPCHTQNNGLYLTTIKNNLWLTTWKRFNFLLFFSYFSFCFKFLLIKILKYFGHLKG